MTDSEYKAASIALRNKWAKDSNNTSDPGELKDICERYIADNDSLIVAAGGHPDPPPPRIRP